MLPDAAASGPSAAGLAHDSGRFFDPRVKCCTYIPTLPNFLVGRILLDGDPALAPGRASVEARIDAGVGATPAGLEQPQPFGVLYERGGIETFGHSTAMRCPHYHTETGSCGIWRHRNSVCSTWFCKYVRGGVGQAFWTALLYLLRAVERSLLTHCVLELDPGPEAVRYVVSLATPEPRLLKASDVDGAADAAHQRKIWGTYAGREREFFRASAQLVASLGWADVVRLGGTEVALAAALVQQAYDALKSEAVPARLRTQPVNIQVADGAHVVVSAYRPYDPLVVPKQLVDVLHFFDGRPTREALAATAKSGVSIERRAVRRLVDFGVLADADGGPGPS